jgi:hypothetical protein
MKLGFSPFPKEQLAVDACSSNQFASTIRKSRVGGRVAILRAPVFGKLPSAGVLVIPKFSCSYLHEQCVTKAHKNCAFIIRAAFFYNARHGLKGWPHDAILRWAVGPRARVLKDALNQAGL